MTVNNGDQLSKTEALKYLSLIMSLMYLARFTRPDVLFALSVLATRTMAPSASDMQHALRVVTYLGGTKAVQLRVARNTTLVPSIFADASHCVHPSGHGHGGIVLTLGSAPVLCRSFKLKLITRSSSESELVCLEEASTYAPWWIDLLRTLGIQINGPIAVHQDNQSTMIMAAKETLSFKRTKHLISREGFVRERITNGDIVLRYTATDKMPADLLTKPVSKRTLESCKQQLFLNE
jgi:hypothetical protein